MGTMESILITEPIHQTGMKMLENKVRVIGPEDYSEEELPTILPDVGGILVRAKKIQKEVYEDGKKLKVISKHGTGVDNIDIPLATEKGIVVANTPKANSISVAEFALTSLLTLSRNYCKAASRMYQSKGVGVKKKIAGTELRGKTIGIFGMGNIGVQVAKICMYGFGMKVLGYDPYKSEEDFAELGFGFSDDRDKILRESDYISLHLPLNEATRDFISMEELKKMKNSVFVVNTSRGGIVNEKDLIKALNEEIIAGAALDVLEYEPPEPEDPIWETKNLLLTPHIAGQTEEAMIAMATTSVQNLLDVLEKKRPEFTLNPEVYETQKYKEKHTNT